MTANLPTLFTSSLLIVWALTQLVSVFLTGQDRSSLEPLPCSFLASCYPSSRPCLVPLLPIAAFPFFLPSSQRRAFPVFFLSFVLPSSLCPVFLSSSFLSHSTPSSKGAFFHLPFYSGIFFSSLLQSLQHDEMASKRRNFWTLLKQVFW